MRFCYLLISTIVLLSSCNTIENKKRKKAVARVNDSFLYEEDVTNLVDKNLSPEDSASIVANYVNTWATERLFIDQAKRNLTEKQLSEFDQLVEDYRNTLYINAYKDAVINKDIDIQITEKDLDTFYEKNIDNFRLNQDIVKLRYLHLPPEYNDIVATQTQFNRFKEEDKEDLLNKELEFLNYSFADSVWVTVNEVLNKIQPLKSKKRNQVFKTGEYTQVRDSTGVYMVKVKEFLSKGNTAPLEYIRPTIRQIILGRRKKDLIKKLEKDIIKDAITNKQYEIYD